jgi:hypothetical protein
VVLVGGAGALVAVGGTGATVGVGVGAVSPPQPTASSASTTSSTPRKNVNRCFIIP